MTNHNYCLIIAGGKGRRLWPCSRESFPKQFVDFFGTYKATLPGLNKMAKLSKAVVIPMFPRYNAEAGKYEMEIHPAMNLSDDPEQSARAMNEEIESFVTPVPEQYVWILQLLRTRKYGEDIYD